MEKLIIYQVLPRLWGKGRMSEWKDDAFDYLKGLGVNCIWYTGIPRHATGKDFVKGNPGSPYAVSDWYDVNPYLAVRPSKRMDEFCALVKRTHDAGLKCIIDFIPNHVARDYEGNIVHHDWCDGDWTDTYKNDYSDARTVDACIDILDFWASKGVDGFRCDMVELVPADAMHHIIQGVRQKHPGLIFIAEAYQTGNYRMCLDYEGFDLLYDKSGVYDRLRSIICDGATARNLTWNWQWLQDMQPRMLNFLENHDEQRLASPWYAGSPERGYAALACSALFNDASFMLYFGQEVGEAASEGHQGRTSIFEWCKPEGIAALHEYVYTGKGLPRERRSVLKKYREVLEYAARPAFRNGRTWDLCYCQGDGFDPDRHFAFVRYDSRDAYIVFCNFSRSASEVEIYVPAEVLGTEKRLTLECQAEDYAIVRI